MPLFVPGMQTVLGLFRSCLMLHNAYAVASEALRTFCYVCSVTKQVTPLLHLR